MRRSRTERQDVQVLDAVWCDMCGQELKDPTGCGIEFASLHASWGYGSGHDGEQICFEICEHCVYDRIQPMLTENARGKM